MCNTKYHVTKDKLIRELLNVLAETFGLCVGKELTEDMFKSVVEKKPLGFC